nr:Spi family protease inhibitor [Bacteroidota bacterium]
MKRFYRLFLLSALVIFQGVAHSGIVHNKLAGQVAKNHYWLQFSKTTGLSLDQVSAELVLVKTMAETPLFYIFNINITEGFVIVSADNRIRPVLGFSNEQSYLADDTNFPPAFIEMLALYTKQIYQVDSLPPDPS